MSEEQKTPTIEDRLDRLEAIIAALLERHPGLPIPENQMDEAPVAEKE